MLLLIYPLFFCFLKRKTPKEKGTGKNAALHTCRRARFLPEACPHLTV
jgi:hypothetical protein